MKLVITSALRLMRQDLARLGEVHHRQFVAAIAPGKPEIATDLVEARGEDEGDAHGLIYLRFHDAEKPAAEFEGWLLDDARHPSKQASPDGGAFFNADTDKAIDVEMSQGSVSAGAHKLAPLGEALAERVRSLKVKISGPEFKSNPPFAHAVAPKIETGPQDAGTLELAVVSARRFTERELRETEPLHRFQLAHSLRPKFAPAKMAEDGDDDDEGYFGLEVIMDQFDSGPDTDAKTYGMRSGVFHVRLASAKNPKQQFDGWFNDDRNEVADSYWPSPRANAGTGRIFEVGTVKFTGVELRNGRVVVDKKQPLPYAEALARGVKKHGLEFDVEVAPLGKGGNAKGFFGSKCHAAQLANHREYERHQAEWKASRKKK